MPVVLLRISPEFVGPASSGTVLAVKLLRQHMNLDLSAARKLIDRAVFDGEAVELEVSTDQAATRLIEELNALPGPAGYHASLRGPSD